MSGLAAVDAGLRAVVVIGIAGFSPVFFLILCSGYALGASFGFLTGAFSILVSAIVTGGVGPWVAYQAFAAGWVGAAAGVAGAYGRRRSTVGWADLLTLAVVGLLTGWAFGALMDIQVWTTAYRGTPDVGWAPGMPPAIAAGHFLRFYAVTSAAYDSFRSAGNALMVVALGGPVLAALARYRARFTVEIVQTALRAS
jgi:energy-coupling factor transport system substrate-specific component